MARTTLSKSCCSDLQHLTNIYRQFRNMIYLVNNQEKFDFRNTTVVYTLINWL